MTRITSVFVLNDKKSLDVKETKNYRHDVKLKKNRKREAKNFLAYVIEGVRVLGGDI